MTTFDSIEEMEYVYPNYVLKTVIAPEDKKKKFIASVVTYVRKCYDGIWYVHPLRISVEIFLYRKCEAEEHKKTMIIMELLSAMHRKAYEALIRWKLPSDFVDRGFEITAPKDTNQQSEEDRLQNIVAKQLNIR